MKLNAMIVYPKGCEALNEMKGRTDRIRNHKAILNSDNRTDFTEDDFKNADVTNTAQYVDDSFLEHLKEKNFPGTKFDWYKGPGFYHGSSKIKLDCAVTSVAIMYYE